MMFPNQIVLKYNKRLRTKEDQEKLYQIKKDIFNMDIDVATTMKKYFKTIYKKSEVTSTKNLSYFNFRGEKINKYVQNNIIKVPKEAVKIDDSYYYAGLELICKKYYKLKNICLYTNYAYILKDITNRKFTVVEPVDDVEIKLDINLLKKHFKLPYCSTVHSVQGLSIDEEICIFDCNTPYVDKYFIWTAITRARDLKNVTYFHHSDNEIKRLEESRKLQYLKLKINYYKIQDMDAKRDITRDLYIDVSWFTEAINNTDRCSLCNCSYYMVLDENNTIMCNISVDRIQNESPHHKENCHLLCIECNCSRGNR